MTLARRLFPPRMLLQRQRGALVLCSTFVGHPGPSPAHCHQYQFKGVQCFSTQHPREALPRPSPRPPTYGFYILFGVLFVCVVLYVTSESFLNLCIEWCIAYMVRSHHKKPSDQWRLLSMEYDRVQGCLLCGGMKFDNLRGKLSRRITDELGTTIAILEQDFVFADAITKLPFHHFLSAVYRKEPLRVPYLALDNGELFYHIHLYDRRTQIPHTHKTREFPWAIEHLNLKNITYSYSKVVHKHDKKTPLQNFSIVLAESNNFSNVRSENFIFDILFRMKSSGWILPYIRSHLHDEQPHHDTSQYSFKQTHQVHEDERNLANTTISHEWQFNAAPLSILHSSLPSSIGKFSGVMTWVESIDKLQLNVSIDVHIVEKDSLVGKVVDFAIDSLWSTKDEWKNNWKHFRVDQKLEFNKQRIMNVEQYQEEMLESLAKVIGEEISKHSSNLKDVAQNWGSNFLWSENEIEEQSRKNKEAQSEDEERGTSAAEVTVALDEEESKEKAPVQDKDLV